MNEKGNNIIVFYLVVLISRYIRIYIWMYARICTLSSLNKAQISGTEKLKILVFKIMTIVQVEFVRKSIYNPTLLC